jgi:hypothetical protein
MAETVDSTENLLIKQGLAIEISSIRQIEGVTALKFKAFITEYTDEYASNWSSTEVFARMDPIWTFQNTKRTIRLAFDVPSFDEAEAKKNLEKLSKLSRMMYPSYSTTEKVSIMSESPIFRLKFMNLIQSTTDGKGLVGIIPTFTFAPDIDQGFHIDGVNITPKTLNVSLDFNVLHQHALGYNSSKKFLEGSDKFPYLGASHTEADKAINSDKNPVKKLKKDADQKKAL